MKMKKTGRKSYRKRLFLLTASLSLLIVAIFSCGIYGTVHRTVLDTQEAHGRRLMQQFNQILNAAANHIQLTTNSVYNHPQIKEIMYLEQGAPLYAFMDAVNAVKDTVLPANPMIHSIYVYNENNGQFYAVRNGIYSMDSDFMARWKQDRLFDVSYPTLRDDPEGILCTAVQWDSYGRDKVGPRNSIFVNYDVNWLLSNAGFSLNLAAGERLFLLDGQEHLLPVSPEQQQLAEPELAADLRELDQQNRPVSGTVSKQKLDGKDYLMTRYDNEGFGWQLYYLIPSAKVYTPIVQVRQALLWMNILTTALVMSLFYLAAKWLYRPVEKIVQQVPQQHKEQTEDEFTAIAQYHSHQRAELQRLRTDDENQKKLLDVMAVGRLLHNSQAMHEEDFRELQRLHTFSVNYEKPYEVCVLSFEEEHPDPADPTAQTELLVQLRALIRAYLPESLVCDPAYGGGVHFALIFQKCDPAVLQEALGQLQLQARVHGGLILTMAFSDEAVGFRAVSTAYLQAKKALQYKILYGRGCLITWEMASEHKGSEVDFHRASETAIMEALARGNGRQLRASLHAYLQELSGLDYSGLRVSVSLLMSHVKRTIYLMNEKRTEPIDLERLRELLDEQSLRYLDELPRRFDALLQEITEESEEQAAQMDSIVERACALVQEHYADLDLSAGFLAEELDMTAAQLGKLFKKNMDQSIPEYINQIRMEAAGNWIRNSDLTIAEIALRSGYSNESYFFRVFKEKYGMTPRQYAKKYREV